MNNINGPNPSSEQFDPFSFLDEGTSAILNEGKENEALEAGTSKTDVNSSAVEYFLVAIKNLNEGAVHAHSLDSYLTNHNFKILEKDEEKPLSSKDHVIISLAKHADGNMTVTTHAAISETIEKKGLILHRKGPNNTERIEDLRDRKITYIGVSNAQYERIFSAANRMIALAAEEYEKNKKKHEEGNKHSFYNRPGFYEKLDLSREWKKLISKINDSEFAKKIIGIKKQIITSDSFENTHKHNEETREKKYEKRMEFYKAQDEKREIIKEYNNKEDLKTSRDKQEEIEDEHPG